MTNTGMTKQRKISHIRDILTKDDRTKYYPVEFNICNNQIFFDAIDVTDLLLAVYDYTIQEKNCIENMLIVECTDEQKEKIKKLLGE